MQAGYEGQNCEIETNECQSQPCQNGAKCIDGKGNFSFLCTGDPYYVLYTGLLISFMYPSAVVYCCCVLLSVVGCSCVLLCVVAC